MGKKSSVMAKVTRLPATSERAKDKRRLHLREISEDPHAQLDSVGATLRAARLNRGVDPEHVANALKMRREHVEAIEDNDFARLPGRTYAIGFVRSYARYLGLDAEVMVQRFKEESAGREHDKTVDLVFPEAPEEKHLPNSSLLLIAIVIAAAIYGAYYISMPDRRHAAASAKADDPAVVVNEAAPAPVAIPSGAPGAAVSPLLVQPSSLLADASAPQAASTDAPAASTLPPAPLPPPVPAATATPPQAKPPAAAAPAPAAPVSAVAPASSRVFGSANTTSRIVFRASATTYILVRDTSGPNGKVTLIDRTLNAGESYRAPDKPGITLVTGNAGGLDVEIDGKKMGTLGKSGEVLNNVPVDASYFLEHMAAQ